MVGADERVAPPQVAAEPLVGPREAHVNGYRGHPTARGVQVHYGVLLGLAGLRELGLVEMSVYQRATSSAITS